MVQKIEQTHNFENSKMMTNMVLSDQIQSNYSWEKYLRCTYKWNIRLQIPGATKSTS